MTAAPETTVHASAVLVGRQAVLIRGASGAGKTKLALSLIDAAHTGALRFARLVGDDRVVLTVHDGRLLVRPAATLAGLIEVRGVGIRRVEHEAVAAVGLVVDLGAADAARLPEPPQTETEIAGVRLPRLAVPPGGNPLPAVLAQLATKPI